MRFLVSTLCSIVLLLAIYSHSEAQPRLVKDYQTAMDIPGLKEVAASEAHLYVISEEEGLAVFRTSSDTLQYLFTNPGMEQRGHRMDADIRFAYLYGDEDNRLTVLEPTSILGVYSSTYLPETPLTAQRIGNHLLVAMGEGGLGHLSLDTPESVDQDPENLIDDRPVHSLTKHQQTIYALVDRNSIYRIEEDGDSITISEEVFELNFDAERLFYVNDHLWITNDQGQFYTVDPDGDSVEERFQVDEPVERFAFWNELYIVRSEEGRVWTVDTDDDVHALRDNPGNRNVFSVSKSMLWMSEGSELLQLHKEEELAATPDEDYTGDEEIRIVSIDDMVIPYPRPVLIPIELENEVPTDDIRFHYNSSVDNAEIRGKGFYWQPSSRQTGRHEFTIVASTRDGRTDSTSFEIDVKRFNSPPRFTPVRPVSIPAEEEYSMPIEARDPDGTHPDLIRYIGVDLPEGSEIDERTGEFTWTPHRRQVGEHTFEVIATDQYGAASTLTVEITVMELERD